MSFTHTKTAAEQLATPVQYLKGVGPDRALLLEKLEIRTARDLLFYFPRSYQDMSELKTVPQLVEDEPASVCGVVEEVELKNTGTGRTMLGVLLRQDRHLLRAVWFNQPQLRRKFQVGQRVMLAGVPRNRGLRWEMAHPKIEFLSEGETPPAGQVLPVYSLTEGLTQAQLRKIILQAIETHAPLVDEVLAPDLLDDLKLWPIHAALPQVHAPTNRESLAIARRRFIFQELLVLQLGLALRRQKLISGRRAAKLPLTSQIDQRIRRLLPFTPTPDQESAIRDVARDMNSEVPMNRLLQGDVGTGKTVVAQFAVLLAIAHGYQAAIMAPTEVLARQHARTLGKSLSESRVRIGLLTGSLTAVQRRDLLEKIAAGQIDLIIGTHAVVHAVARSQTQFAKLGLVIIDEQHKFGVRQRAVLKQAGLDPHYLVMTATPIPRTMSMTLFGDLDVSTIRRPPPGRQGVHSYFAGDDKRERWWEFYRKKLREGRQGYVIAPLVDDPEDDDESQLNEEVQLTLAGLGDPGAPDAGGSDSGGSESGVSESGGVEAEQADQTEKAGSAPVAVADEGLFSPALASAERLFEELTGGPLSDFRLDLIHGRMSPRDKDDVMERFRRGDTQVLVATSVVEVGVDVPNATLMTIESGERFGLAQLHQLRGRITRGGHPGYLCVFADPKSDESRARLEAFVKTSDGFELAELDFRLRGPGDLFGTRQHGLPPLRIADLLRDGDVLLEARAAAQRIVAADTTLADPRLARLRRMVLVRYGEALELVDVG